MTVYPILSDILFIGKAVGDNRDFIWNAGQHAYLAVLDRTAGAVPLWPETEGKGVFCAVSFLSVLNRGSRSSYRTVMQVCRMPVPDCQIGQPGFFV